VLATVTAAAISATLLSAAAIAAPHAASPIGYTIEYPLSNNVAVGPVQLTTTPDGSVWYSSYLQGTIGRFLLPGTLNQFAIPSPNARPSSITVGSDGNIWFAETAYDQIGRVSLSADCYGLVTEFTIPSAQGGGISGLATDKNHRLWFTAAGGDIVGRIDLSSPNLPAPCVNKGQSLVVPFELPTELDEYQLHAGSGPNGISIDAHGKVWIAESDSSKVARIDPTIASNNPTFDYLSEWSTPTPQSNVLDIAAGAGNRVWFTESDVNRIGMIPADAAANSSPINEYPVPTAGSGPAGITAAPDGAMWFAESTVTTGAIGRITPAGKVREFATPAVGGALIVDVATAANGALWYTNYAVDSIGSLSTGLHPARVAPHPAAPRIGAWACPSAVWGTTPLSSTTTWLRDGVVLSKKSVSLARADLGHRYVCRSSASLPGLNNVFVSATSVRVDALLTKPTYSGVRGKTITIYVVNDAARTVKVQLATNANAVALKSVTVRVRKGLTQLHLFLAVPKKQLKPGRYVVRIDATNGTHLTSAPLSLR
jgi:virginiamycin B lyase